MSEHRIIADYFASLSTDYSGSCGLKNDAAVLATSPELQWVITVDAFSENRHFFSDDDPSLIARRLLRTNLSDLAAMGATPRVYLLTAIFPRTIKEAWIAQFCEGLKHENNDHHISLIGGDTITHDGPLSFSITAMGEAPIGPLPTRSQAKPGDLIYVSGTLGDAALGLALLQTPYTITEEHKQALLERHYLPTPRLALGQALAPYVSTMMDVSDGLIQDAGHIAKHSECAITLEMKNIPLSEAAKWVCAHHPEQQEIIWKGGDDYELLFTIPPQYQPEIEALSKKLDIPVTQIGNIKKGTGVMLEGIPKDEMTTYHGFDHFSDTIKKDD